MRILITNDDGIYADGIETLATTLAVQDVVYVIASDQERSTSGHAITRHKPLRIEEVEKTRARWNVAKLWQSSGTPADNIKLGVTLLLSEPPDLILSGINRGANLGRDVYYSGTISAAMEGMFLGIPSIALSFDGGDETTYEEFSWCSRYVRWWIHSADFEPPSANVFYNVNFPHWSETPPTQLVTVPLGHREYKNRYIRRLDPQNHEYFWFEGRPLPATNAEDSDVEALKRGLITLTPIKMDVTDYELLKRLKSTLIVPNLNS